MPTVGWIREGNEDEYLSATEDHEETPRSFPCPLCKLELDSQAALEQHLRLGHPKRRPDLRIDDHSQPRNLVVRKPISPDKVQLVDVTNCSVSINGAPHKLMSVRTLREKICKETYASWDVQLLNESELDKSEVKARYRVDFRIPPDSEMRSIETAFLSRFSGQVSLAAEEIERFRREVQVSPQSSEYVDALANYCLAAMLRDAQDANLVDVTNLLKSVHGVVNDICGRLPSAVASSIKFSLNYFSGGTRKSRSDLLDVGVAYFTRKARCREFNAISTLSQKAEQLMCPIDRCSLLLLRACAAVSSHNPDEAIRTLEVLDLDTLTEEDRVKAWVIYADSHLLLNRLVDAIPYLHRIQYNYMFGRWASEKLEGNKSQ